MLEDALAPIGNVPTLTGLLVATTIMRVGFHRIEASDQPLSLQLRPEAQAPEEPGRIASAKVGTL